MIFLNKEESKEIMRIKIKLLTHSIEHDLETTNLNIYQITPYCTCRNTFPTPFFTNYARSVDICFDTACKAVKDFYNETNTAVKIYISIHG